MNAPVTPPSRTRRAAGSTDWSSPFSRLAIAHTASVCGEALLAISLAGSLFFKVDPAQGREKVLLGLALTMAPFALVGPLIGPAIDRVRGGHRVVIVATMVLRAVVAAAMVPAVADGSLLLFPEAFLMLVLGKTYQVAKAAVVPSMIEGETVLVEANSKLQLLAGLASVCGGLPGFVLLQIGPEWVVVATALTFGAASKLALALPRVREPEASDDHVAAGEEELRGSELIRSTAAMTALRSVVGFTTFLLAFELRSQPDVSVAKLAAVAVRQTELYRRLSPNAPPLRLPEGPPSWYFGAVLSASILGGLVGAAVAPALRRQVAEERILAASTLIAALGGVLAVVVDGLVGLVGFAGLVAVSAALGKQAFDAIVQRRAPDADRGRVFARFESRFQVAWVVGGIIPTALTIPTPAGAALVAMIGVTSLAVMLGAQVPDRPVGRKRRAAAP
ncbi:MAG: hypothetical protein KA129_09965 [Microthrixaceae bacterium]|nr:hypothetical protein [Microthrixaceae bacterium]